MGSYKVKNYTKRFIKIYFWRTISFVTGFLSLLIVVPLLSNEKEIFGIYSYCISFTLYLTYADIGFLNSAQKYAAEAYSKGDRDDEMGHLGFVVALLCLMFLPFSLGLYYLSSNPSLILGTLNDETSKICSNLFLILSILTPIQIILQRALQSILMIRIKEYISLKIDIITNLTKIISIYLFIGHNKYNIVGYYLFVTLISILSYITIAFYISKTEKYEFHKLITKIKLSSKYYNKVKRLAISSFISTICWILFYEIDQIIIGSILGPIAVAIYAVSFTFINFLRNIWNIIYSPFLARLNHFTARNENQLIRHSLTKLINYTFPLSFITTLVLYLTSDNFVYLWVGKDYVETIPLMKYFILSMFFIFLIQPANYFFIALKKYKYIYLLGIIPVITFYSILILSYKSNGIQSFGIAKFFSFFILFIISLIGIHGVYTIRSLLYNWWISLTCIALTTYYLYSYQINPFFSSFGKNKTMLVNLLGFNFLFILITSLIFILITSELRIFLHRTIVSATKKDNV